MIIHSRKGSKRAAIAKPIAKLEPRIDEPVIAQAKKRKYRLVEQPEKKEK